MQKWRDLIFSDRYSFEEKAARIYEYQRRGNPVYKRFCDALGAGVAPGGKPYPLLPVHAFKDARVRTGEGWEADLDFVSSGTTEMSVSSHQVRDASLYRASLLEGFRQHYKPVKSVVWAYTPGYGERPQSSLVWMLQELIESTGSPLSGFLSLEHPLKEAAIKSVEETGRILILFGPAFGLLDLVEAGSPKLPANSIVIETGGMKTHRKEITRKDLHRRLSRGFGLDYSRIHSEYGMAELLSQAYAIGGDWFRTPPWLQFSIRNPHNPSEEQPVGREGLIGLIDLANVHSCAFLLTGDRGTSDGEGRFQVHGRWKQDDLRGCNFLLYND